MSATSTFTGSGGLPVRSTLHEGSNGGPIVVVCHGFKGFREWGFFPWLCDQFAEAGLDALRIDFSHNGVEETDFDRLDLFLLDTWTRHQEDLKGVVSTLGDRPVALVGHSRGGADAILYAATDQHIRAVVTLAGVADTTRTFPDTEEKLRTLGYYPVMNSRTKQTMPVSRLQFEDGANFDVLEAASKLGERPLLAIHGEDDEAVPPSDATTIATAHGNTIPLIIANAGHTFGAGHPFDGPTTALEQVAKQSVEFLRAALGAPS